MNMISQYVPSQWERTSSIKGTSKGRSWSFHGTNWRRIQNFLKVPPPPEAKISHDKQRPPKVTQHWHQPDDPSRKQNIFRNNSMMLSDQTKPQQKQPKQVLAYNIARNIGRICQSCKKWSKINIDSFHDCPFSNPGSVTAIAPVLRVQRWTDLYQPVCTSTRCSRSGLLQRRSSIVSWIPS